MDETATSQVLLDIFTHTAQPVWSSIGRWVRDGMCGVEDEEIHESIRHDQELCLEKGEVPPGSLLGRQLSLSKGGREHRSLDFRPVAGLHTGRISYDCQRCTCIRQGVWFSAGNAPASFPMQGLPFKQRCARSENGASKEVEPAIIVQAGENQILAATVGMSWGRIHWLPLCKSMRYLFADRRTRNLFECSKRTASSHVSEPQRTRQFAWIEGNPKAMF
jgi:hypothetical protein